MGTCSHTKWLRPSLAEIHNKYLLAFTGGSPKYVTESSARLAWISYVVAPQDCG